VKNFFPKIFTQAALGIAIYLQAGNRFNPLFQADEQTGQGHWRISPSP
jgi:hypothetical protein